VMRNQRVPIVHPPNNSSTPSMHIKNYFPSTQAMRAEHRNAVGSHDDHDNFDGSPTSPWHPPQAQNIVMPPSTREASMTSNSNVWHDHNKSNEPSKFLSGSHTKTSSPLFNATIINSVDDDIQHPQPTDTAPRLASLQEWNKIRVGFDKFFLEFAKFHDKYGPSTKTQANAASIIRTCSIDDDDNRTVPAGGPEFI